MIPDQFEPEVYTNTLTLVQITRFGVMGSEFGTYNHIALACSQHHRAQLT